MSHEVRGTRHLKYMIRLLFHKDNRNFLRLWLAQLVSQFGDRIHQLALVGLIAERSPGSTFGLAKIMAFTILPVFVIQPFAGVFVDRFDRRTTLFICDIVRGVLILAIPYIFLHYHSMVPIYIIVFLVFCFSRFHVPAKLSILPDLVDEDSLYKANSLITTTGMIAAALGAMIGAFLIEYYGARNGFIIDAITFFISALFLFNITQPWRWRIQKKTIVDEGKKILEDIKKSVWQEMKEGFDYLLKHKEFRFVVNVMYTVLTVAGAIYIVMIVFIQETFNSVTKDLGVLALSLVIGLFCGVIAYGHWGKKFKWYNTIFLCLICGGLVLVLFSQLVYRYPILPMACGLAMLWGVTIGPIFIASNTVVHIISDENMRGKVFSALEIVINLAFLIAMFISSWLSEIVGMVWILTSVGGLCVFLGLFWLMQSQRGILAFDGKKMA